MRNPASRFVVVVLALFVGLAVPRVVFADARADAKAHYQAAVKLYGAADYRGAIVEFNAAQQLMPADLNLYNLALCYDKLGEAEPAIQNYRAFLNAQPNADKRAEIEASIARLEGALKSASAKKDAEAKAAEDARKADEAKRADEAKKAEDARKAEEAKKQPANDPNAVGGIGAGVTAGAGVGVGSTGTPGTGQVTSTGDAQLDRVQAIDINGVRDQRMGGGASGMPDTRGGPAVAGAQGGVAASAGGPPPPNGGPQAGAPQGAMGPNGQQPTGEPPKKATPVYKKWWFWAVVAVSAYVVYSIAADGSSSGNHAREVPNGTSSPANGGVTLFHF